MFIANNFKAIFLLYIIVSNLYACIKYNWIWSVYIIGTEREWSATQTIKEGETRENIVWDRELGK